MSEINQFQPLFMRKFKLECLDGKAIGEDAYKKTVIMPRFHHEGDLNQVYIRDCKVIQAALDEAKKQGIKVIGYTNHESDYTLELSFVLVGEKG